MKKIFFVMALLCLNFINTYSQSYNDCRDAFPICEMKTYHFGYLNGFGEIEESFNSNCFNNNNAKETNSLWLNWYIEKGGTVMFTINPTVAHDDIDFILYRKEDNNCNNLIPVRCMATGENLGSKLKSENCFGKTGLRLESLDEFESQGCKYNDDNFLKYLSTEKGEEYLLLINNYNSHDGFSISFEGNSEFRSFEECEFINPNEEILITKLFPNPTTDEINVQLITHNKKEYSIKVLDISGKEVYAITKIASMGMDNVNISVENFISGTYILVVSSEGYSTTKRFVKK